MDIFVDIYLMCCVVSTIYLLHEHRKLQKNIELSYDSFLHIFGMTSVYTIKESFYPIIPRYAENTKRYVCLYTKVTRIERYFENEHDSNSKKCNPLLKYIHNKYKPVSRYVTTKSLMIDVLKNKNFDNYFKER